MPVMAIYIYCIKCDSGGECPAHWQDVLCTRIGRTGFFPAESNYSGEEQESLLNVLYRGKVSPSSAACLIYSALHCKNMHLTLSSCFLTHLATFLTL